MFKALLFISTMTYSLAGFTYAISQQAVGDSKTRVEFTIQCANGEQRTIIANANQLGNVTKSAEEFCKSKGGIAKRDGIRIKHSIGPSSKTKADGFKSSN
jgi:putative hemolysin